jgi:hypothetical protein
MEQLVGAVNSVATVAWRDRATISKSWATAAVAQKSSNLPRVVVNQISPLSSFLRAEAVEAPSSKFQVRLVESGTFDCKYVIGGADENAVCCGAPTDGKSWCAYHRRIVFTPRLPARVR